ncbi:uncharacterized protein LOC117121506 isoform X2 [Anneissia japonica]|uniref:uncharacterized protein LOC117121506 isoform X2 n=2 Tax=Anneissia japonica TaxID=1529436 RepID=UPI001425A6A8|nr:uncharacterized protein LOC117121506 isoform X2 [Anneissia japonica]
MEGQSMNLKLTKLSVDIGQATGDEIIFAIVDSVKEGDIEVYFVEKHTGWKTKAKIEENGVLSNNIMFYTPSYVNENITSNVKVAVQLRRPSDGVWSNALPFTFVPSLTNKDIPLEKQMDMHSNLKAIHFTESDAVGQDGLGGPSKPAIQNPSKKCQKLYTVMEHQKTIDHETCISSGEFYKQVKSSQLKPSKDNLPVTDIRRKYLSTQHHKKFSVSEDSGFGSIITSSNEEQLLIEDVYKASRTQEFVPNLDSQQSTKSVDDASENCTEVEVDCLSFRSEIISSIPNLNRISKHNLIESSLESTSSGYHTATSTLTSPEDSESGGITYFNIHSPTLDTNVEIIPCIEVDCSGACLKPPGTAEPLNIPSYDVPEGKVSKTQDVVPELDSQQSTESVVDDASEKYTDVEVDCLAFQSETISSIPNPHCISKTNVIETSVFKSTSTSILTSPEDIRSGGIIACNIHSPPLETNTEIIPGIEVDCSGACLKLPGTGVQLIIPPYAIPKGSNAKIGLALDRNYLNIPGEYKDEGCIAPIITCLPNHYKFQKPVLIVFPHSVKEVIDEKECINLYTNENDPDQKKHWKQVKYNQKGDTSSPVLFLKNQYAYLFVGHFTDYIITLPSGEECSARYLRIVVYANELIDCETNQEVRIYCHGERHDLEQRVEKEEKALAGIQMAVELQFELFKKPEVVLKVSIEFETGWHMKTRKKEQFLKNLWRKDYGSCKYTFKNIGQMRSFYCNISIQQIDCEEEVSLEVSNTVKHPIDTSNQNAPAEPLRGPPSVYMVENGGNQPLSTDSGHTSFYRLSGSYLVERYHGGSSYSSDFHSHSSNLPPNTQNDNYVMPRQMSCPHDSQGNMLQNVNLPDMSLPKLPHKLRMELCCKLDTDHPLGDDWRRLASNLNLDNIIGKLDARSKSPTLDLLNVWESRNETLDMLVKRFNDIDRSDAANLVKDYIDKTKQSSNQQILAIGSLDALPRNNIAPTGLPNQSLVINQERPVGRNACPEEFDLSKMSTSSSSSSIAITPDRESELPAFQRTSPEVFYDQNCNSNMSELNRSIGELTVNDVANANNSSNKPS